MNDESVFRIEPERSEVESMLPSLNFETAKKSLDLFRQEISRICNIADAMVVDSDKNQVNAVKFLTDIKRLSKAIEQKKKEMIEEPSSFVKAVSNLAKEFLTHLSAAETTLKSKVLQYSKSVSLKRQEEQKKIAEEVQRVQKELDDQAAEKGLEPVVLPTPILPPASSVTRTETGTAYTKKEWTFRIIDSDSVPREYMVVSEKAVRAAIAAGIREIPGIEIYEKEVLSVRL